MLPNRPYLLRAIHDWIVDSGCTPHLLVDADNPDLQVPDSARRDGKVVLNVSPSAVRDLIMEDDLVTFVARFGGVSRPVTVPMAAVQALYARENGRGMLFPDDEDDEGAADQGAAADDASATTGSQKESEQRPRPSRPNLRVVK